MELSEREKERANSEPGKQLVVKYLPVNETNWISSTRLWFNSIHNFFPRNIYSGEGFKAPQHWEKVKIKIKSFRKKGKINKQHSRV